MEECEGWEWQNLKDWAWDDWEVFHRTLYGTMVHFLAGWFDEFRIDINQNQYPHISMNDLDRLFEDNPEVEVTEKDGTFYVKAVFYTDCEKKKDNPNKCTCARKTISLVYRVDRSKNPIIQHIDGKTDIVENECSRAP